ncbi:MAG: pilus assembly protein N-terminal domain-containing protein [Planctomycetota bacterium]|nr:pilus assembly protein N-terminal domain-containing protein [Planctomycetota bacterium]
MSQSRIHPTTYAVALCVLLVCGGVVLTGWSHPAAFSQQQTATAQPPVTRSGLTPRYPVVPDSVKKSKDVVAGFLDSVTIHDGQFEVVIGQARLLTLKKDLAEEGFPSPVVAVGDPSVLELDILPNPRLIRLLGRRVGVTELSLTTSRSETYSIEVSVVYDLPILDSRLKRLFPDAAVKLSQMHDHIVVEGQARGTLQANQILSVVRAYLSSVQVNVERRERGKSGQGEFGKPKAAGQPAQPAGGEPGIQAQREQADSEDLSVETPVGQVINLLKVPEPQQVLLKVQVAELNRTALRQIGADILYSGSDSLLGTQIGGAGQLAGNGMGDGTSLAGILSMSPTSSATAVGIFESASANLFLKALRRNSVLKILAEPNLVAMNGHKATFLAGGEFPIPVAQGTGAGNTVTIQFREFGVQLGFEPFVMQDGNIRLAVSSVVSSIDFSLGTTLVPGGNPVPGLSTRNVQTTVELNDGKTLMMAGLLQVSMDATVTKIPGLGELPTLGPLFRNNTGTVQEKELIVLVTPYIVDGLKDEDLGPLPGEEVFEPTDREFFLKGRTEGRSPYFRSTTHRPSPPEWSHVLKLEERFVKGCYGYSN